MVHHCGVGPNLWFLLIPCILTTRLYAALLHAGKPRSTLPCTSRLTERNMHLHLEHPSTTTCHAGPLVQRDEDMFLMFEGRDGKEPRAQHPQGPVQHRPSEDLVHSPSRPTTRDSNRGAGSSFIESPLNSYTEVCRPRRCPRLT